MFLSHHQQQQQQQDVQVQVPDCGAEVEVSTSLPSEIRMAAVKGCGVHLSVEWEILAEGTASWKEEYTFARMEIQEEEKASVGNLAGDELWNSMKLDSLGEEESCGSREEELDEVAKPVSDEASTKQTLHERVENQLERIKLENVECSGLEVDVVIPITKIIQFDTEVGLCLRCSCCDSLNGERRLIHIKSCGCVVCSMCIIYSAIRLRRVSRQASKCLVSVPCPATKLCTIITHNEDDGREHVEVENGDEPESVPGFRVPVPCQGLISVKELEFTLSPDLFEEISQLGKRERRKRPSHKIHNCTTPNCLGFCTVNYRTKFFHCPLCSQWSNCLKCGENHNRSTSCSFIEPTCFPPTYMSTPSVMPSKSRKRNYKSKKEKEKEEQNTNKNSGKTDKNKKKTAPMPKVAVLVVKKQSTASVPNKVKPKAK